MRRVSSTGPRIEPSATLLERLRSRGVLGEDGARP